MLRTRYASLVLGVLLVASLQSISAQPMYGGMGAAPIGAQFGGAAPVLGAGAFNPIQTGVPLTGAIGGAQPIGGLGGFGGFGAQPITAAPLTGAAGALPITSGLGGFGGINPAIGVGAPYGAAPYGAAPYGGAYPIGGVGAGALPYSGAVPYGAGFGGIGGAGPYNTQYNPYAAIVAQALQGAAQFGAPGGPIRGTSGPISSPIGGASGPIGGGPSGPSFGGPSSPGGPSGPL